MIRRATPEDAEAVADVFADSFATLLTFLPDLHTHEERRAFIRNVVMPNEEVWVAEHENRVVGFAALRDGMLGHLYVDPALHGRGFGTALLDKTKELLPHGFSLWTFPANTGACRFYERHGLRAIEYGDGSGNEEGVPDVRYEWLPARE